MPWSGLQEHLRQLPGGCGPWSLISQCLRALGQPSRMIASRPIEAILAFVKQHTTEIVVTSHGPGMIEFTDRVVAWVRADAGRDRALDPSREAHLRLADDPGERRPGSAPRLREVPATARPRGDPLFRHTSEGPDDMPAHVRAALTATTLSIPVVGGAPTLGTWQGIYLYEHRTDPHTRKVAAHLIGE